MGRSSEFQNSYEKPASMYLEWSSNDKAFKHWNGSENVLIELPLKFAVLKEMHTVKGWHDKSESGIYSNEVKNIGSEILEVKSFKGGTLVKGIYKEVKDLIQNAGGKYYKSIYAMLEDGTIINIAIKGSAVKSWGEFIGSAKSKLVTNWVEVNESLDGKKGSIKFSTPVFVFGSELNPIESGKADDVYNRLESLLNKKTIDRVEDVNNDVDELEDEDVDF